MKIVHSHYVRYGLFSLFVLSLLSGMGCSGGFEHVFHVPSVIKTEKTNSFKLGTVSIDPKATSAAFLVLRKYENNAAGEIVEQDSLRLGDTRPITYKMEGAYQFSYGKQKLQITIYLDDNQSGKYDDGDSIAKTRRGLRFQKVIEIEVTSDRAETKATFPSQIETTSPLRFEAGTFRPGATKGNYYLVIRLVEDGIPGKTLGVNRIKKYSAPRKHKVTLKIPLAKEKQKIHMALYNVVGPNPWKIDSWDPKAPIQIDINKKKVETTVEVILKQK